MPGVLKRLRIRALLTAEQWVLRRLYEMQDGMKRLKTEDEESSVYETQ